MYEVLSKMCSSIIVPQGNPLLATGSCLPRARLHASFILLFILPVAMVRMGLQPFFPGAQNWADFFSHGAFFVLGYLLLCDERFLRAIRRDWWILLGSGIVAMLAVTAIGFSIESFDLFGPPGTFREYLLWGLIAACGWCWTAFMFFIAMRYLDRDSKVLRYGLTANLPFFVVHQPVILAMAYFVVQWEAAIAIKLLVVIVGAFVVSIGLTELVKRVSVLQVLFGMKVRPSTSVAEAQEALPASLPGSFPSV